MTSWPLGTHAVQGTCCESCPRCSHARRLSPCSTLTARSRDNKPRTPPPTAHIFITDSYLARSAARGNLRRRCAPLQQRFPTSSGPQLCVGKLRLLPVLPADTHASAGTIPSLHRCMKNAIKCVRQFRQPLNRSYFCSSFCPFLPLLRKKMALKFRI